MKEGSDGPTGEEINKALNLTSNDGENLFLINSFSIRILLRRMFTVSLFQQNINMQLLSLLYVNEALRNAYTDILTELLSQNPNDGPQFKTWFYIYQNNTVKKTYRKILEENYKVEVKDVERFDYDFKDDEKREELTETGFAELTLDGDLADLEEMKKDADLNDFGSEKEASKFDKHVDDSQYVDFNKGILFS